MLQHLGFAAPTKREEREEREKKKKDVMLRDFISVSSP